MADMAPQGEPMPRFPGDPGHEETEGVSVRGVFAFAAALVALGVVIHFGLALVMDHYSSRESREARTQSVMMASPVEIPGPRLQDAPGRDRIREQEIQLNHLNGYGWIDRQSGIVHIPIDRAMDLLAERGLPEVKDTEESRKEAGGDTNAGRNPPDAKPPVPGMERRP